MASPIHPSPGLPPPIPQSPTPETPKPPSPALPSPDAPPPAPSEPPSIPDQTPPPPSAPLPEPPLTPTIELEIAAADLPRLLRNSTLIARRNGRFRTTTCHRIWHDTAAATLREQGLALSEQAGQWRLERLTPDRTHTLWPPAGPPPILAEAASPGALSRKLTSSVVAALVPVAAFTGTNRSLSLLIDGAPARLQVLQGALRGIAHDEPACRVNLSGPDLAIAALAAQLASQIPLLVPRASLAARAIAQAGGIDPPPRQLGAPAIPPSLTVSEALVLVIGHLTDVMLHWAAFIPNPATTAQPKSSAFPNPEPVHQMRVAVRRLRAALAIFRRATAGPAAAPLLRNLGRDLKELAAILGHARDWDVFLTGAGAAIGQSFAAEKRVTALLAAAARKRHAAYVALATHLQSPAWRHLALQLALLPASRPWSPPPSFHPDRDEFGELQPRDNHAGILAAPIAAYAAQALHRSLKRVTATGEDLAALSPEAMHDARKHAKHLRYACEFFAPLFPAKPVRRFLEKLEDVQETLGAVNDSHVAAALMAQLATGAESRFATGVVQGYVAASSAPAARHAGKAWAKLLRQPVFWD